MEARRADFIEDTTRDKFFNIIVFILQFHIIIEY